MALEPQKKINVTISDIGKSEAICTAAYFAHQKQSSFTVQGFGATIDIGGATTDYTFWNDGSLLWEDSAKFAGSELLNVATHLTNFVGSNFESKEGGKQNYEDWMRQWPFVRYDWYGKLEEFHNDQERKSKVLRSIALFYGGIFFYLGLHLRKSNIKDPVNIIALAGNGIRFLDIISSGLEINEGNSPKWLTLFQLCLTSGQQIQHSDKSTTFLFSKYPKHEVAKGLVVDTDMFQVQDVREEKMLGLDVEYGGKKMLYKEWADKITAKQFSNWKIDFSILHQFVNTVYDYSQHHFKEWKISKMTTGDESVIQQRVSNALLVRGNQELANTLFFEALNVWMNLQYNK